MTPDRFAAMEQRQVGSVPEGWRSVRLGELFEQIVDTGHSDDLPVLSVTLDRGVIPRASLDRRLEREVARPQYLRACPGDIAYNTMRMWQGGSGLVREEGYLSPAYTICRAQPGEDPEFWAFAFKSEAMVRAFRAHSQGFAKDRYRLYFQHFATVPALQPPLPEQRKIATFLAQVDETIEKSDLVIRRLADLKRSATESLMTKGLPGLHKVFRSTAAGTVPLDWEIKLIRDTFVVELGKMLSKIARRGTNPKPYLRNANVRWGSFDLSEVLEMDFNEREIERFRLAKGDLLVCEGGEIGRCAVWKATNSDFYYQKALHRLRPKGDLVQANFARHYFEFKFRYDKSFGGKAGLSTIAHLPKERIEALPIPIPSKDEQVGIAAILDGIVDLGEAETGVLENLKKLKSALTNSLLTGKIRVTPEEAS